METREELVRQLAESTRRQFAARGPLTEAPSGELNSFLGREIAALVAKSPDPYRQIIEEWDGFAHQLDLAWWESEATPKKIVLGLAAAVLEHEVRHLLDLPR